MGGKHYFFKKPAEHYPHQSAGEKEGPAVKDTLADLEVVEVVRDKYCFIVYMALPESTRIFKFSIKKDGRVFGFSHNYTLSLTEPSQRTIKTKLERFFKCDRSYIISIPH